MVLTGKKDEKEPDGRSCHPAILFSPEGPAWYLPGLTQAPGRGAGQWVQGWNTPQQLAPKDSTMSDGQHRAGWAHSSSCCCHGNASFCLSLALPKTTKTQWIARFPWARCLGSLCTVLQRAAEADWAEMEGAEKRGENSQPAEFSFPILWSVMHSHKYTWTSSSGISRSLSAISQRRAQVHLAAPGVLPLQVLVLWNYLL